MAPTAATPTTTENDAPAAPAAPPWARRAAVLTVLTTVPSALWRSAMAVGLPVGVDAAYWRQHYGFPGRGTAHVIGLDLLLLALALLTLGLASRWARSLRVGSLASGASGFRAWPPSFRREPVPWP